MEDDGQWLYTWDGENRLIEAQRTPVATGVGAPDVRLVFTYDGGGRRILRESYSPATSTTLSSSTLDLYDGWNCITEYEGNTLSKRHTWGSDLSGTMQGAGGVGGLLFTEKSDSSTPVTYTPVFDGNGNVMGLFNTASHTMEAEYEYDPFGNVIRATGPAAQENRYRFSTKPQDEELGFFYYGYRWYDPVTGRWPSRDPIGEEAFFDFYVEHKNHSEREKISEISILNLYTFVSNDSVNQWDYLGLEEHECGEGKCCYKGVCIEGTDVLQILIDGGKAIGNAKKIRDLMRTGQAAGQNPATAIGNAVNKFGPKIMCVYLRQKVVECNGLVLQGKACLPDCEKIQQIAKKVCDAVKKF